jgi:SWI/SNF-related matrix-associated actin-dependent regulator 1 of chromatin subfamily A
MTIRLVILLKIKKMGIPEIDARNTLLNYNGGNNQLLEWKRKMTDVKNFKLTRPQSEYVLKYHEVTPKVAKKNIMIFSTFGEKLMEDRLLTTPPQHIWCEKLLCETEKAYHIWGKILETEQNYAMWLPKAAVVVPEKKLDRIIDYSPYDHRPPMEHQKVAVEKLLANNKFILADDMGVGKTTSATIAALESGSKKILIVCPASLKINWKREIENYTDRRVFIVEGRRWGSTFDFYIINYDILKNFHTTDVSEESEDFKLLVNEKFDLAIVDEAHYISNNTANRTRLLNDVLETIPKVWLLTGTPMTSRPINYFNLLKIVDSPLALNWASYVKRYCKGFQFSVGGRKIWNTSGASNLDELREKTKNLVLRRLKTDVLDLPEKIITPIFIELESKMYKEEVEEFSRVTNKKKDDENETITITLNRLMKIRQLISYEKIPYTCELIDKCLEQGKKVIVLTNFTMTLDMIHEKYKKNSVVLDGRMSKEKKQVSVDRFQNEDKIKVFIGNIKAAGVGITLTEAEVVIMNDLSFVPADHSQGEDRAYRYGQKNCVLVYYPIFENTIEKTIYNILQKKKNIIDQVMGDGEYSESFAKELIRELL